MAIRRRIGRVHLKLQPVWIVAGFWVGCYDPQSDHASPNQEPLQSAMIREANLQAASRKTPWPLNLRSGPAEDAWTVETIRNTSRLIPNDSGCLVASNDMIPADTRLNVLAQDSRFYLIGEDGSCIFSADTQEIAVPADPPAAARSGEIVYSTQRYEYDDDGCPQAVADLPEHSLVDARARSFSLNYQGFVAIDTDLGLAPVRHVAADGWIYPWQASVQMIKPVDGGYVIGGGVLIAPDVILTARHLEVDESWCYTRSPNTGEAWYAGEGKCANIVGPAENHPDGVDAALVYLLNPEPEPYTRVREAGLVIGEPFFVAKWSQLHQNAFADSTIERVRNDNAFCLRWPSQSSFLAADTILEGGDSGGPAWIGDELVGLVHGEKCYKGIEKLVWMNSGEPAAHVLVNVPGIYDFVEPVLP